MDAGGIRGNTWYLNKTASVVLDSAGRGVAILAPDVGQWWAPVLARVSTKSQITPVAYCAIHHGSVAPNTQDGTTFIDDTYTASSDTTSMVSGVIVQSGEGIIAKFSRGSPGDIAVLSLYGSVSDVPQGIGDIPDVPGTHFQGRAPVEIVQSLLDSTLTVGITPGTLVDLTAVALIDMRAFNGFYFSLLAQGVGPGTPLTLQIRASWKLDSDPTSTTLFSDSWEIFANTTSGTPVVTAGTFQLQDNTHGPFLKLEIRNSSPAGNIDAGYRLVGTSHQFPGQFIRQLDFLGLPPGTPMLLNNFQNTIAAAATFTYYCLIGYGRAMFYVKNNSMPFTIEFFAGSRINAQQAIYSLLVPATQRLQVYLTLPKNAMRINFTNTGAGNGTIEASLIMEYMANG